jgi:hypothetical protein
MSITYSSIVGRAPSISEDLEPRSRAVGSASIRHFAQVRMNRSPVRTTDGRRLECGQGARAISDLLVHLNRDGVTGLDSTSTGYSATVDVAPDVVVGDIGQRVVRRWHADACFSLIDTIDPEILKDCMAGDARGRQRCHDGKNS